MLIFIMSAILFITAGVLFYFWFHRKYYWIRRNHKSECLPVWKCDTCSYWYDNRVDGVETPSGGSECVACFDRSKRRNKDGG